MLKLLILLIPLSGAYFGKPLETKNLSYQALSEGPSCTLLQHRKKERDKVLRERYHLDEVLDNESVKNLVFKNQFLANQYFIDDTLWDDDLVEVSFLTDIDPDLSAALEKHGLQRLYFSIKGTGFEWSSFSENFPEGFLIEPHGNSQLKVSYPIYRGDYCYLNLENPSFSWLGPDEDMGERFDSFHALENLRP